MDYLVKIRSVQTPLNGQFSIGANNFEYQSKEGEAIVEGRYDESDHYLGFEGGKQDFIPIAKAAKPSKNHNWDTVTKTWVGDIMAARAAMRDAIKAELNRRFDLPIVYDGKTLDADPTARDNISGKISELAARDALNLQSGPFIWRDADNITHTWLTKIAYRVWLHGLIAAISSRKTNIYTAAWAHKDALQALPTVEEVEAYNYLANWPS